jgi:hypothetical protein
MPTTADLSQIANIMPDHPQPPFLLVFWKILSASDLGYSHDCASFVGKVKIAAQNLPAVNVDARGLADQIGK